MSLDKENWNEYCHKIHEILINEWDPIEIKDIAEAQDEYDSYIPQIHKMLASNKSIQEVEDYLYKIETENMGLDGKRWLAAKTAKRLFDIKI